MKFTLFLIVYGAVITGIVAVADARGLILSAPASGGLGKSYRSFGPK